jgi:hypothetical protein
MKNSMADLSKESGSNSNNSGLNSRKSSKTSDSNSPTKRASNNNSDPSNISEATANELKGWSLKAVNDEKAIIQDSDGDLHTVKRGMSVKNMRIVAIDSQSPLVLTDRGLIN